MTLITLKMCSAAVKAGSSRYARTRTDDRIAFPCLPAHLLHMKEVPPRETRKRILLAGKQGEPHRPSSHFSFLPERIPIWGYLPEQIPGMSTFCVGLVASHSNRDDSERRLATRPRPVLRRPRHSSRRKKAGRHRQSGPLSSAPICCCTGILASLLSPLEVGASFLCRV